MDPNLLSHQQGADINEMIQRKKIEQLLAKTSEVLSANGYLPLEPGYALDGQPIMLGLKFDLDHTDLSACQAEFGYATVDEFVPIEAEAKFTGWSEEGLPNITVSMDGNYSGPLEGFSFHNQLVLHVEKSLTQLALMLAHVKAGMAPASVLKMPTVNELKESGIILPGGQAL